jgi:hypothetical protein
MTVNTSNQSDTDFRETIPVTNGVNYDVSVWVYHPAGSNIRARLFYAGNYSNFYSDPTNSGVWQELTASFVANGDTVEIGLRFYSGDGTIVYIDDFTVSPQ